MNNREELIHLIELSFEDEFLSKSEKRQIKSLLIESNSDKNLPHILRSEFFNIAEKKVNSENFQSVIGWIESMNKLIISAQPKENQNERVYFSPGMDCLNAILNQIKGTKQLMRICLFTISDNRISNEIIKKHRQGVNIQIITDNDKVYDKGSDVRALSEAGIKIKVDNTDKHMHHKFALFDKKTTLTGSYNWTRSAERYNNENIILTESVTIHRNFDQEFKNLWQELDFF